MVYKTVYGEVRIGWRHILSDQGVIPVDCVWQYNDKGWFLLYNNKPIKVLSDEDKSKR